MCSRNKSKAIPLFKHLWGFESPNDDPPQPFHSSVTIGSAVTKAQKGRHPQSREVSAEPLAPPCRTPSVRSWQPAQPQSPPCARPAHSLLCASFQPRLGLSARDWSRTLAKAGLHMHEGHEVGGSRLRAARPALRLHFQHPSPPGKSNSRTARHSNWKAQGFRPEHGESRRRAQTRDRIPKSLPARTLPPGRPRPAPWVPHGPARSPEFTANSAAILEEDCRSPPAAGRTPDRRACPRRRLNRKSPRVPLRTACGARAGVRKTPDSALTHSYRFSLKPFPFK